MTTIEAAHPRRGGSYFAHPLHGPLPAILLLLTFGTGLVDAISIIGLGRVFVANMTGNVVFVGFALARVPGFSLWGSVVALAGFLLGAGLGSVAISRFGAHRGKLLRNALIVQLVLFVSALAASFTGGTLPLSRQLLILAVGALALGIQNAVVRHLGVPGMTTTVLTMTLTGIGSDLRHRDFAMAARHLNAVLVMLIGAGVGAIVLSTLGVTAGILAVTILLVVAVTATAIAARGTPDWAVARPRPGS